MSGWPLDWDRRRAGTDCNMCATMGTPDSGGFGVLLFRGRFANAYLMRPGVVRGYAVAIWNGDHAAEPTELTVEQAAGFWTEVLQAGRAVEAAFRPVKMNYQLLGNALPHLHAHLIPRYLDDPAPGRPLPFEFLEGDLRPAEVVAADAELVRSHLTDGGTGACGAHS